MLMGCVLLANGMATDSLALRSHIAMWTIFIRAVHAANNLRPSKRNSIQHSASLPPSWTRGCSTNQYAEHPLTDATPSFPAGAEERRATITDRHSQMSFCVCLCDAGLLNTPLDVPTLVSYDYPYWHFTAVLWRSGLWIRGTFHTYT